jgi:hypothetical protein
LVIFYAGGAIFALAFRARAQRLIRALTQAGIRARPGYIPDTTPQESRDVPQYPHAV